MEYEIVKTEDGTISVKDKETGELHHNRAGAYTEALLNYVSPSGILDGTLGCDGMLQVLDVPFGLGYNTFVLLNQIEAHPQRIYSQISITGIELDPDLKNVWMQVLKDDHFGPLRLALTDSNTEKLTHTGTGCTFSLSSGTVVAIDVSIGDMKAIIPTLTHQTFDVIFHDPFSPKHCPQLWSIEIFRAYKDMLAKNNGKLLTYSSASAIRGGIREAGFHVYRTQAVGGKSGGTVACVQQITPDNSTIFALTKEELNKINSASGIPYRNPTSIEHKTTSEVAEAVRAQRMKEQTEWRAHHDL